MKFIYSIILILIVIQSYNVSIYAKLISDTLKETYVEQLWNVDKWESRFRNTYYYNAENLLVLKNLEETYTDTGWTYISLREYFYRADNKIFDFIASRWENEHWINTSRRMYNYDTSGNRIEYLLLLWDEDKWVNKEREEYSYNVENKIKEQIFYSWDINTWKPTSRNTFYYDSIGLLREKIREVFDTIWIYDVREENYYENSKLITQYSQNWNGTEWINNVKNTFGYDSKGMDSIRIEELWTGSEWKFEFKKTTDYDEKSNLIEEIEYVWIGEWLPRRKDFYVYDDKSSLLSQTTQIWYENRWVNYQRNILESLSNIINNYNPENYIFVFPNPATNSVQIRFSLPESGSVRISITDIFGYEATAQPASYLTDGEHIIHFSDIKLSKGIYFIRLEYKSTSNIYKLIISE